MKVVVKPSLRPDFELAAMARSYGSRLLELSGNSEQRAKTLRDEWIHAGKPVFHKWPNYNSLAFIEATQRCSPTEKRLIIFTVEFDHDKS